MRSSLTAAIAVVVLGALAAQTSRGATAPNATPTATVNGQVTLNGAAFNGGSVPFGSLVEIESGTMTLTTGVGTLTVFPVPYVTAAFVLRFTHVDGKPYVQLQLAKGDFSACPKRTTASVAATGPGTPIRALWGNGKGNFQTRGRFAAATVRGTHWRTDDRCDGTWMHVVTGVVDMSDLRTGKTTVVRAGGTHLVLSR